MQQKIISIGDFINGFAATFDEWDELLPWQITAWLPEIVSKKIATLDSSFTINNGIAIHSSAIIEPGAIIKAPAIIGANCFVAANACIRAGVYAAANVKVGMGCEIKSSIIFCNSSIAHFNFIGDSIIGNHVNFEAGSITANHFNERKNKTIQVVYNDDIVNTNTEKFGALVGDHSKIGANAALSPGTILKPGSIVKRLELVEQLKEKEGCKENEKNG